MSLRVKNRVRVRDGIINRVIFRFRFKVRIRNKVKDKVGLRFGLQLGLGTSFTLRVGTVLVLGFESDPQLWLGFISAFEAGLRLCLVEC